MGKICCLLDVIPPKIDWGKFQSETSMETLIGVASLFMLWLAVAFFAAFIKKKV